MKEKLQTLYNAAQNKTPFEFLKALLEYMTAVQKEPILQRIVKTMFEDSAAFSISSIKESLNDPDYREIQTHIDDEELEQYPTYSFDQLKKACEEYESVKGLSEDSLSDAKIVFTRKSEQWSSTVTTSGKSLLIMAEKSYPEGLKRLHAYLIEQLQWIEKNGVYSKYFDYDEKNGLLYFQGKEIRINTKKVPTNAHYLLKYLFKHEPFRQHFYDELEDADALLEKKQWKSYYDACMDIQKKAADATGILDFLDFSTGKRMYVRINEAHSVNKV